MDLLDQSHLYNTRYNIRKNPIVAAIALFLLVHHRATLYTAGNRGPNE